MATEVERIDVPRYGTPEWTILAPLPAGEPPEPLTLEDLAVLARQMNAARRKNDADRESWYRRHPDAQCPADLDGPVIRAVQARLGAWMDAAVRRAAPGPDRGPDAKPAAAAGGRPTHDYQTDPYNPLGARRCTVCDRTSSQNGGSPGPCPGPQADKAGCEHCPANGGGCSVCGAEPVGPFAIEYKWDGTWRPHGSARYDSYAEAVGDMRAARRVTGYAMRVVGASAVPAGGE